MSQPIEIRKGENIRLHITRNTEYGDRYKLYTFKFEENTTIILSKYLGLNKRKVGNDYIVNSVKYAGLASKKGVNADDKITLVEISNIDQIKSFWGYVFGILLLCFILFYQSYRFWSNPQPKKYQ